MPNFFFSFQGGKGNRVKSTRGVYCKSTRGVYCKNTRGVSLSKLFTGGDKCIIPNIGALVNTLYLNVKD